MSRPCFFVDTVTGVTRVEHLDVCPQVSADGSLVYTLLTPMELDKVLGVTDLFGFDPESVPRVRGDEPVHYIGVARRYGCSPRPRG